MNKLRKHAQNEPCIRCGRNDGTTVLAHYNGMYNHWFGNGMGTKSHDLAAAHLCSMCHEHFDHRKSSGDEREADFLLQCLRTVVKLEKQGKIK